MNKYIKPAFMLTTLEVTLPKGGNCSIKGDDVEELKEIIGPDDWAIAFGATEGCAHELESYCKFTSGELGATQAFFS